MRIAIFLALLALLVGTHQGRAVLSSFYHSQTHWGTVSPVGISPHE